MTIYVDVAVKSKKRAVFRAIAQELLDLEHSDWNDWEWNWLHSMLRYPKTHKYTEAERLKLDQLSWLSEPFTGHDGLTVEQMIATCYRYHLDFGEDDSDFIVKLHNWNAKSLRRRQLWQLVRLCRQSGEELKAA
jgi:hypothetical protein